MNADYEIKAFQNPDGSWAVRVKGTALDDKGKPIRHPAYDAEGEMLPDDKRRPVFAEVEVSTPKGPKSGEDTLEWAMKFAKSRGVKAEIEGMVATQLASIGLGPKSTRQAVSSRIRPEDL